jgi:outer membrane usher protein
VLYVTTSRGPCRVKVPDLPKVVASGARPKPAPQQCIPEVAP